jgi:hypothetical protein
MGASLRDGASIPFAKSAPLFAQSDEVSPIAVIWQPVDARLSAVKLDAAKDHE